MLKGATVNNVNMLNMELHTNYYVTVEGKQMVKMSSRVSCQKGPICHA